MLTPLIFSACLGAQTFQQNIQPVLAKHCFACHNSKQALAKLDLASFRNDHDAGAQPRVWEKVREKVSTRKMPPAGQPALNDADLATITKWIDGFVKPATLAEPGRVVARRLNRVEYNNTIRDLLGVPGKPADEFPVDDSGYGFDNVGDVLTVSPMLMEKYMAAANRISRLAVYGEAVPAKPTRLVRLLGRRSHDANDVASGHGYATYLPFSMRGALYGTWTFPVDAEYEFRLRIANFRPDPPRRRGVRTGPGYDSEGAAPRPILPESSYFLLTACRSLPRSSKGVHPMAMPAASSLPGQK